MERTQGYREKVFLAVVLGVAAVALGLSAPTPAMAAVEHPFLEAFGATSGSEPSFDEAQGLAVDQATGDLLVIDRTAKTLSRWHADGTPAAFSSLGTNVIEGLDFGSFVDPGEVQVAVDNSGGATEGDIYVTEPGASAKRVDIFDEDGNSLGQLTEFSGGALVEPCGVGADPSGNVYLGDFSGEIHRYANPPVNGASTDFPFSNNCTLAAGAGPTNGFLFAAHFHGSVERLDSTNGSEEFQVDPGPVTTLSVDPTNGRVFLAAANEVREYDASGASEAEALTPIASGGEAVTGVAVDGASGNLYVARENTSHIEVWGPAAQLPEATTEEASELGDTVTFHGAVGAAGGPPASCVFQYVEVSAEGFNDATSVPCSPAGPFTGTGHTSVSAEVSGLPEAAYRFRLLASNEEGSKDGGVLLFNTFESLPGLPDGRTYEMVSPAQKGGEVVPPEPETQLGGSCDDCLPGASTPVMPMQSASDGEAVLYQGQPFFAGLAAAPNEYVAKRNAGGWSTEGLSTPSVTGNYVAFSADLARGVLAQGEPALSPLAPSRGGRAFNELYVQQDGQLQPLVTVEPPNRDPTGANVFQIRFAAANAGAALEPALGHLVFEANDSLTGEVADAPPAPVVGAGEICSRPSVKCNVYEWEGGQLRLVNVLPGNAEAAAGAVVGAGTLLSQGQSPAIDHAVSDDGGRIFWTSLESGKTYARVGGQETLEIPGPGNCSESVAEATRVCFLTASADGAQVLLSDGQLYELNGAGSAYEPTTDLTEGKDGFQGILGATEDLSDIYFVDTKILTGANAEGNSPEEGGDNAYFWHAGSLAFIGTLLPGDDGFGVGARFGAWAASPSNRTAQVSGDGRFLAFMSQAPLTGYDNSHGGSGGSSCNSETQPHPGVPCQEVFEYDAEAEELSCASCNPSGALPVGPSNLSLVKPTGVETPPFPQLANLSPAGDGRLFFESQDVLAPGDVNGHIQDVYEWEPGGIGSCKRAVGCVYLISSGTSANDSMFLDSSAVGDDAFLITRQQLLPRDQNQQLDLYNARVGGGIPEAVDSPCSGEACAGPIPPPPTQPGAASDGVSGPGNLPQSAHKKPSKHKKKRHHRHHHHKHHKRSAGHGKGAGR